MARLGAAQKHAALVTAELALSLERLAEAVACAVETDLHAARRAAQETRDFDTAEALQIVQEEHSAPCVREHVEKSFASGAHGGVVHRLVERSVARNASELPFDFRRE